MKWEWILNFTSTSTFYKYRTNLNRERERGRESERGQCTLNILIYIRLIYAIHLGIACFRVGSLIWFFFGAKWRRKLFKVLYGVFVLMFKSQHSITHTDTQQSLVKWKALKKVEIRVNYWNVMCGTIFVLAPIFHQKQS